MLKSKVNIAFLAFFLIAANLWFYGIGQNGLGIPRNNIAWLWISIILTMGAWVVLSERELLLPKEFKLVLLGVLLSILPMAFSTDHYVEDSIFRILGLVGIVFFAVSLMQFKAFREKPRLLLYFILVGCTVQLLHGSYQSAWAVLNNLNAAENGIKLNPAPLGVFNQRNVFASYMATGLAICGYLLVSSKVEVQKGNKLFQLLGYVFTLLSSTLIVLSTSLTSYISLSVLVVLLAIYGLYKKNLKVLLLWVLSVIVGCACGFYLLEIASDPQASTTTVGSRLGIYLASLIAIKDAPVFGHGLGSFDSTFLRHFADAVANQTIPSTSWANNVSHPHNELLYWAVEGGIVSALGILLIGFMAIKYIFSGKLLGSLAGLALIIPIALHSMTELPFYISTLHLIVLVMLVVFFVLKDTSKVKAVKIMRLHKPGILKGLSLVVLSFLGLFFLSNMYSIIKVHRFLSSPQPVEELDKVMNTTGWDHAYNAVYRGVLMNIGLSNDDPRYINQYINWAEATVLDTPRIEYFQNLVVAYAETNQIEKAKSTASLIVYLYPNNEKVKRWYESFTSQIK